MVIVYIYYYVTVNVYFVAIINSFIVVLLFPQSY